MLVLAGCQTAPQLLTPVTPLPHDQQPVAQVIQPIEEKPIPTNAPVAAIALPPTALPTPVRLATTNGPAARWVEWDRWSEANGAAKPQPSSARATHSFELHTANGIIAITVGSRLAYWKGLAYWLGFAPQLIRGKPYIHSLDAEKSFLPLLPGANHGLVTNRVLVIDPGHGGMDSGTKCVVAGKYEKDFTLDWALRLRKLLANSSWTVYLTRTNDIDLSLAERVQVAEEHHADLFISLHFNSGSHLERSGLETYCLTPPGMPSSLTRGFADDIGVAYPNNEYDGENLQLAVRLHRALIQATGRHDLGVGRARFMGVLRGQKRPAVLLEGGYLSNPQEARLIADTWYRKKLAEAVAKGLEEWREGN